LEFFFFGMGWTQPNAFWSGSVLSSLVNSGAALHYSCRTVEQPGNEEEEEERERKEGWPTVARGAAGGGGEEEQWWFAARNCGSCCSVIWRSASVSSSFFMFFFLSLLLLCFYSFSFLCRGASLCVFLLVILPFFVFCFCVLPLLLSVPISLISLFCICLSSLYIPMFFKQFFLSPTRPPVNSTIFFVSLFLSVFISKKWGERSTTHVQSWHRGRGCPGGHGAVARRACPLCFFHLVPGEGHGSFQGLGKWGERNREKIQGSKPLLPLPLHV